MEINYVIPKNIKEIRDKFHALLVAEIHKKLSNKIDL